MEDLDESVLKDTLDSIEEEFELKVQNIGFVIKEKKADLEAIQKAIQELQERKTSTEKSIKNLQEYIQSSMDQMNIEKVKTPLITVWIQNNPYSVTIEDESEIPTGYFTPQKPKLNKKELIHDLKMGAEIHGVELTQARGLRIK